MSKAEKKARYEDVILNRCNFFFFFRIQCLDFPKCFWNLRSFMGGCWKFETQNFVLFLDVKCLFTCSCLETKNSFYICLQCRFWRFLYQNLWKSEFRSSELPLVNRGDGWCSPGTDSSSTGRVSDMQSSLRGETETICWADTPASSVLFVQRGFGELSGTDREDFMEVTGELAPKHLQRMKSPGFAQMSWDEIFCLISQPSFLEVKRFFSFYNYWHQVLSPKPRELAPKPARVKDIPVWEHSLYLL